jgi:membrane protein insertase Oxa1/YidC/SpoIIIJ
MLRCRRFSMIPTDIVESGLHLFHSTTGSSWGVTIIATTFAFRTFMTLPMTLFQRRNTMRLNAIQPMIKACRIKVRQAELKINPRRSTKELERITILKARGPVKELYKKHNCSPWKNLLSPLIQIPLFVTMSMAIRKLCGSAFLWSDRSDPAIGVNTEGLLWFEDLTISDPTLILPIVCSVLHLLNTEVRIFANLRQPVICEVASTFTFKHF